MSTFKNFC